MRRSFLTDPKFQVKYTLWLVGVVSSVMVVAGLLLGKVSERALESARLASRQAERALEESRANAKLVRLNAAMMTAENPELGKMIDDSLGDSDKKAETELARIRSDASSLESNITNMRGTLVTSGFVMVLVLAGMGLWITQRIVGPVLKLKRLLRRIATGRLVVGERLRKFDELGDLFETVTQMTHSIKARERARILTLDSAIAQAKDGGASEDLIEALRSLRAQLEPDMGMEALMRRSGTEFHL